MLLRRFQFGRLAGLRPVRHAEPMPRGVPARGYRWNDDGSGQPRAWYIDVPEAEQAAECAFLHESIYGCAVELPMRRLTAYERFSVRG